MGKKNRSSQMWDFPEDDIVHLEELICPLGKIMREGYRLERTNTTNFVYRGFNIDHADRICHPTPEERFDRRWLDNETKFDRSLLDNVLAAAVLLGMAQGRLLERGGDCPREMLESIMTHRSNTIRKLHQRLAEFDPTFVEPDILAEIVVPDISDVSAEDSKEEPEESSIVCAS